MWLSYFSLLNPQWTPRWVITSSTLLVQFPDRKGFAPSNPTNYRKRKRDVLIWEGGQCPTLPPSPHSHAKVMFKQSYRRCSIAPYIMYRCLSSVTVWLALWSYSQLYCAQCTIPPPLERQRLLQCVNPPSKRCCLLCIIDFEAGNYMCSFFSLLVCRHEYFITHFGVPDKSCG